MNINAKGTNLKKINISFIVHILFGKYSFSFNTFLNTLCVCISHNVLYIILVINSSTCPYYIQVLKWSLMFINTFCLFIPIVLLIFRLYYCNYFMMKEPLEKYHCLLCIYFSFLIKRKWIKILKIANVHFCKDNKDICFVWKIFYIEITIISLVNFYFLKIEYKC